MKLRVLSMVLFFSNALVCQTKDAQEVFAKWINWQKVFSERPITGIHQKMDRKFENAFVSRFYKHHDVLSTTKPFLSKLLCDNRDKNITLSQQAKDNLSQFYQALDRDTQKVLSNLQKSNFINASVNTQEQNAPINDIINKNKKLLSFLLCQPNKNSCDELMFGIANRFFEFCFDQKTFPNFNIILADSSQHQIGRFFYTTMWYNLVGEGWKHWHSQCLSDLIQDAKNNKEIVYIAGGNDIYQLLKNKIYNIRVIDPMLPSQPEYYAEGWEWLVDGKDKNHGIGDQLTINFPDQKLVMRRSKYQEHGAFSAKLSTGETVSLPKSTTEWKLFAQDNNNNNKQLGTIIFERRFCDQKDFVKDPKKSILLSFNEMYFVAMPHDMGGWGIDALQFAPDLCLRVKQLRKPVYRAALENLRKSEASPFTFILLGSCPT